VALVRAAADAVLFARFETELVRDGRETLRAELSRLEKFLKPRQIHPSTDAQCIRLRFDTKSDERSSYKT
jgi:hypothetical protein